MATGPVSKLLKLAAGFALAAALGCAWPTLAEDGKGGRSDDHSVPSLPIVGGGGASPGGTIGNGISGGVGGPSGGLGGSPRLGGGGGGGGGSVSPLSPNFGGGRDSFRRGGDDDGPGGGPSLSPIYSGREGRDDGHGLNLRREANSISDDARRLEDRGRDRVRELDRRGRDDGDDDHGLKERAEKALSEVSVLTQAREAQARDLLQNHRDVVEPDAFGHPVVRGEILALAPSKPVIARAERAGFRVRRSETLPELGVSSVVLIGPRGVSAVEALRRLRALDPQGQYDLNHIYQESGRVAAKGVPAPAAATGDAGAARGVKVGLVDGAVAPGQPALAGARVVQKPFAEGGLAPSPHATAVASLIAGRRGAFRGAAPGASLFVADVYGSKPTGGSADAIVRALAWLAQTGAPVINISLVGPPNLLLEAGVKALIAKGRLVVAAVGNDGPAAPPLYPASYPGVVAVTGVDARRRLLPEASRGSHVDFAAPGAEMAAAGVDGGFVSVRGTSFAAPIAAGLLARVMPAPGQAGAERALALLGRQALDLGPPGQDKEFGRGLVGVELRTPPAQVSARYALRGP